MKKITLILLLSVATIYCSENNDHFDDNVAAGYFHEMSFTIDPNDVFDDHNPELDALLDDADALVNQVPLEFEDNNNDDSDDSEPEDADLAPEEQENSKDCKCQSTGKFGRTQ